MPLPHRLIASGVLGGGQTYQQKVLRVDSSNPIAYWPMNEASGAVAFDVSGNGRNAAYTGVTLGQPGIGDGNTCPLFDGANDYCNLYSASFAAAFSGAAGTYSVWIKPFNSGVWTDGAQRFLIVLRADVQNRIYLQKGDDSNFYWVYEAADTEEPVALIGPSGDSWWHVAFTWDKAADQVKAYMNGAQNGATQTTLNTWVGALSNLTTVAGAQSIVPANPWNGYLAHVAVWTKALTPAQILSLATV